MEGRLLPGCLSLIWLGPRIHGFQMLSDAIALIMACQGYDLVSYSDNYIIVSNIGYAQQAFDTLMALSCELGVSVNPDKVSYPCQSLTCLGITVDTVHTAVTIDNGKLTKLHEECSKAMSKNFLSKNSTLGRSAKLYS